MDEIDINLYPGPTILLEQSALVYVKSAIGPTMNTHEFITYELDFNLNNPYLPTKEEIIGMLDDKDNATNNEPIEEVDIVQIDDVVVDKVRVKDVKNTLMTLKQFLEQRHLDVTPLIQSIQTL